MKYILTHNSLRRSARSLADGISRKVGEQILVKTQTDRDRYNQCIIRFGNSSPTFDRVGANHTEYNNPQHIALAGNKFRLSNFLSENDGEEEKLPNLTLYNRNIIQNDEFPVVVRTVLNGNGGNGIIVCKTPEEFSRYRNSVWSHWYNFQFELGVHILGGNIVKVFKKVRQENLEEEEFPIRNTQRGYSFKLKNNWREVYKGLQEFVSKLYGVLPIQFARLDVGYDKSTGGYRLIEINSAPNLSENVNTLNLYVDFLVEKLF